jgi:hypothetical protein
MATETMMLTRVDVTRNITGGDGATRELRVVTTRGIVITAPVVAIARRKENTGRGRTAAITETGRLARKMTVGKRGRLMVTSMI